MIFKILEINMLRNYIQKMIGWINFANISHLFVILFVTDLSKKWGFIRGTASNKPPLSILNNFPSIPVN